jgi:hypothetical protein
MRLFYQAQRKRIYFMALGKEIIPTAEQLEGLAALEDIVMVGYPIGLWDKVNNMPIIRRGITATHPKLPYNGREEFMIDAACFPGSSGSPVVLYNETGYIDRNLSRFVPEPRVGSGVNLCWSPSFLARGLSHQPLSGQTSSLQDRNMTIAPSEISHCTLTLASASGPETSAY